ncbi:MAG: ribonuclease E/G, partial [Fusobacterium sp. JB020]|nr:ribonuclease E/G [Fusobacterium sp. JB020]
KLQEDKDLVIQQLDSELKKDRLKNNIVHFTDLGLIEMTRKRVGRNLSYFYQTDCPRCNGLGKVRSIEGTIEMIIRELKEVSKEMDIKIVCLLSTKEIIDKIKEVYFDILKEYFKKRGKYLKFVVEEINNKSGYDILLEK